AGDRHQSGAAPADQQDDRRGVLPRHRPRHAAGRPERHPRPAGQEQGPRGRGLRQLPGALRSLPPRRLHPRGAGAVPPLHRAEGLPVTEAAWRFTILGYPVGSGARGWLALGRGAGRVAALAVLMAYRRRGRVRALLGSRLGPSIAPGAQVGPPAMRGVLTGTGLVLFSIALA